MNEGNLKPFKKGQSGNPNGRPKKPDLDKAIAEALSITQNGKTALEAVITVLLKKALKGDLRAIKELLDRGYGQSLQNAKIDADVEMKGNITIERKIISAKE